MKITRSDAVALCVALGFKTAKGWNKQRMVRKLVELSDLANDGGIEVEDDHDQADELNALLNKMAKRKKDDPLDVVKESNEEEAEVVEDSAAQEEVEGEVEEMEPELEEPKKQPKAEKPVKKQPKAEKPVKKQPKAEKPDSKPETRTHNLDRFGSRMGTQAHRINEVMTENGITMDEICKATGLQMPRVASHVAFLVKTGRVKKTDGVVKLVA